MWKSFFFFLILNLSRMNVLTFADLKLVRRSPREPPRMCIRFNYLWTSWRIINSGENCVLSGALKGIGVFESVWFDFKQRNDLFVLLFKAALECSLHTYLRFLLIGSHRYAGNYCVLHCCLVFGVHILSVAQHKTNMLLSSASLCGATRASERKKQNN